MARQNIGSQTGIVATRDRLKRIDETLFPGEKEVAYDNQATTLTALVNNDKDHESRLASIEQALASRPF